MKQLKRIAAAALAAAALTATLGAAGASATTLEVGGITTNASVSISASLKSGTSAILRDTFGFSAGTCTSSSVGGSTEESVTAGVTSKPSYTGSSVTGAVSTLSFTSCSDPVTVHKGGTLHVAWTSGTNGTLSSSAAEWTADGPFGYLKCVTSAGTHFGTLTGVPSGNATMDINASLDCGISAKWVATYTVTSPGGLGVSA